MTPEVPSIPTSSDSLFCSSAAQAAVAEQKFKAKCFCSFQDTLNTGITVLQKKQSTALN